MFLLQNQVTQKNFLATQLWIPYDGNYWLRDMLLIDMPFKSVAVDLIKSISPATEKGHKSILILVDDAGRYSEAVPLKELRD